jgi:hypothetical protein
MTSPLRLWQRLRVLYLFFLPIRVSVLALVIAAFTFTFSDQGSDILRAIGEVDPASQHANWAHIARFLFFLNLLAYQIWFCARQMLRIEVPAAPDDERLPPSLTLDNSRFRPWILGVPRLIGALLFVVMLYATYRVRVTFGRNVRNVNATLLVLIATSLVLFLLVTTVRRRWLESREDGGSIARIPPSEMARHVSGLLLPSLLISLLLLTITTFDATLLMGFGAGSLLLLTLSLWVPVGSLIVYAGMRVQAPILTILLLLAVLVSPIADRNHVIRRAATASDKIDQRPTVEERLNVWHDALVPAEYGPDDDIPIFIVAAEGGGIRSAYWTATVLDSLGDAYPQFRRNLFALTGMSGGSLGIMTHVALLSERSDGAGLHGRGAAALSHDFLTPTLAALTQSDLIQRFLPIGLPDRERALEKAWERGYQSVGRTDTFGRGLLELYSRHPELPNVFLNGTMIETGDRIITSNCRIRPNRSRDRDASLSLVFRSAWDGIDLLHSDLPLSAAVGMSARFGLMTPAGRLSGPGGFVGHVGDGGYFESSGASTASELVLFIEQVARARGWHLVPVVVVIDHVNCRTNGEREVDQQRPGCQDRYAAFPFQDEAGPERPPAPAQWASELLAPLQAVIEAPASRGRQEVGDLLTAIELTHGAPNAQAAMVGSSATSAAPSPLARLIEFRLVQRDVTFPLGWMLSRQSQVAIEADMRSEGNRWARDEIGHWLRASATEDPLAIESERELMSIVH